MNHSEYNQTDHFNIDTNDSEYTEESNPMTEDEGRLEETKVLESTLEENKVLAPTQEENKVLASTQEENKTAVYHPWSEPIVRRDHCFENTGKPRFPGSSLSSGVFKEKETNKEWLGKSIASNKEKSEAYALKERIAADIYAYFGVEVPKIELSLQKMANVVEMPELEGKECIHTMSELLEDFKTYKEAFGDNFKMSNPNPNQEIQLPNGERIKERGLGKVLAVAVLINDIDVIGANGGNIGFKISNDQNRTLAQTIKIDPGAAFDMCSNSSQRMIRVALTGTPKETELSFDELPMRTKQEFARTLNLISQTSGATFRGFFTRQGAHNFVTYYDLTVDKLTKFLMDRKTAMLIEYQECLDKYRNLQKKSKRKENNLKKDAQSQAIIDEIKAYQEELYYYIDPNVVGGDDSTRQIPFTTAIDEYLDFERETSTKVMLIKGESGAGKSLALRFLEQRLLDKRRDDKSSPMPIHIDLKKFSKQDVKQSFENTLKEKYHEEHDPKKLCLILLMDGYDEIAGGCQLNLYNIQQLDRYSQNIRVIITCRTQYLTSGYQEWFKPAVGDLKELEIKEFNEEQIQRYLMKYSRELEKTGAQNYPLLQYQKKIEAYPGLKELIVNPFILRLVADSLPRMDDYMKSKQTEEIKMKEQGEEVRENLKPIIMNRYVIYECFMEHWFAKQELRLAQSSGISDKWEARKAFRAFSRNIALLLLSKREVEIKVQDDERWNSYFGDSDHEMVKARNGCPLRRFNDHLYSFIHKSFLEYFAARGILDTLISNNTLLLPENIKLSTEMITQDQGVISFFRDAFALDSGLKDKCFNWINASKVLDQGAEWTYQSSIKAINASNSITLLNVISYDFSKIDLKNIYIPRANLSHGTFHQTDFTNANLTGVNFASAWLEDANFKGANLNGVNFGEWPYLQFEEPICCISFSADGKIMAAAMGTSIIIFMRDETTGNIRELKRIQNKSGKSVEYCKLTADGKQAIICTQNDSPCMWDITTEGSLFEIQQSFGYEATTFDFSLDGKNVVFSSEDNSLRIWNIATGRLTHEFRGHLDKITNCKFSPDGTQIVSASRDKTLRIWDVVGGLSAQKVAKSESKKKCLNLTGANIEDVVELSDTNLMLLYQRGACGFSEKQRERFIEKLNELVGNQGEDCVKLDLSQKSINNEGAWGIGKFTAWFDLKDLNLSQNCIGNKGATGLGSNLTWMNLMRLNLSSNLIEEEGAQGLANNRSWCNLEELDLRNNKIGDDGAKALSKNIRWERLQNIYLEYNNLSKVSHVMRAINEKYTKQLIDTRQNNLSESQSIEFLEKMILDMQKKFRTEVEQWKDERKEGFINIIKKRDTFSLDWEDFSQEGFASANGHESLDLMWMPNIKTLDLSRKKIRKEAFTSLAANLSLVGLEELILPENELGNEYLNIIATNLKWKNLKKISLLHNSIDDHGVITFMSTLRLSDLEEINLSKNNINNAGIKAVGSSKALKSLKKLLLYENKIGNDGVIDLAKRSTLDNLEVLDLSNNRIDDKGGFVIGENETWKNLLELNLSNNLIGDKSAFAIGSNDGWKKMKKLDLSVNKIGEEGGVSIAKNQVWSNLEELNLSDNNIGDRTVCLIGENDTWKLLTHLLLGKNKIKEEGGCAIGANTTWSHLEKLDLSKNCIREIGIDAISKNIVWRNLKVLLISENDIGDEGAKHLSKNRSWISLNTLDLTSNNVGEKGIESLSANTTWNLLKTLHLKDNKICDIGAGYLSNNTSWIELQTLVLSYNNIHEVGAKNLAKNKSWKQLRTLDLSYNNIGENGAEYLGKNPAWVHLQTLSLQKNDIRENGAACLSKNTCWSHLQTLDLSYNTISEKGAENFIKNTSWPHLQSLSLADSGIGDQGAEYLSKNASLAGLQTLNLERDGIGDKGAEYLSKDASWTHLQALYLFYNIIGERGAELLSKNVTWTLLKTLHLKDNKIGDRGAEYLSNNKSWIELQTLVLSYNNIHEEGAKNLGKNTSWTQLQTLDLSYNNIGENGAEYLSKNTTWTRLQTLDLRCSYIGDKGAAYVSINTCWSRLQTLDLSVCNIGKLGTEYLSKNKIWTQLETLNLSYNNINEMGAEYLSDNTTWSHLQSLDLSHNKIGEKGAEYMNKYAFWTYLQTLDLSINKIGEKGAEYLSSNTTWPHLQILHLSDNSIGERGAEYLSKNTSWTYLQTLDLRRNDICQQGAEYLSKNESWPYLKMLDLSGNNIGEKRAEYSSIIRT